MSKYAGMLLALALVATPVAGCASDAESGGTTVIREVVTETVSSADAGSDEADAPSEEPAAAEPSSSSSSSSDDADASDESQQSSGGDCIDVPDVVGKDHQLAQDTMQAAGLYALAEDDASGEGRALLFDRNWTTVKQDPAAGTCVPADTTVTLSAVKDGE